MMTRSAANENKAEFMITFIYYRDLRKGIEFYGELLGFPLEIDQGWSKIYRVSETGYLGIVDETRGFHKWRREKTVQICLRVQDISHWYRYLLDKGVTTLSEVFTSEELKIKAFVFEDPEGYQIEIQEPIN